MKHGFPFMVGVMGRLGVLQDGCNSFFIWFDRIDVEDEPREKRVLKYYRMSRMPENHAHCKGKAYTTSAVINNGCQLSVPVKASKAPREERCIYPSSSLPTAVSFLLRRCPSYIYPHATQELIDSSHRKSSLCRGR